MAAEPPQATVSCPSDTTKGLCDRPLETFAQSPLQLCGALRWQVAAALSAAVTTTKQQETTLQLAAAYCMEEKTTRTAATLRMRGSGGEVLLLEKRPLPQRLSYPIVFRGGSAREGTFLSEKSPPSQSLSSPPFIFSLRFWGGAGIIGEC